MNMKIGEREERMKRIERTTGVEDYDLLYYPNDDEVEDLILRLRIAYLLYSRYNIGDGEFIERVENAMRRAGILDD